MSFAPVYLIGRLLFRIGDFFHHWYIDGSRRIIHFYGVLFLRCDQTLALRQTVIYFFHPLYGDYSIVGRVLGFIFRSGRIAIGVVFYACLGALCVILYALWVVAPIIGIALAHAQNF